MRLHIYHQFKYTVYSMASHKTEIIYISLYFILGTFTLAFANKKKLIEYLFIFNLFHLKQKSKIKLINLINKMRIIK